MSHKSGTVIINSMLPQDGGEPLACLDSEQCDKLREIRLRDEYTMADRIYLGLVVVAVADDPAD